MSLSRATDRDHHILEGRPVALPKVRIIGLKSVQLHELIMPKQVREWHRSKQPVEQVHDCQSSRRDLLVALFASRAAVMNWIELPTRTQENFVILVEPPGHTSHSKADEISDRDSTSAILDTTWRSSRTQIPRHTSPGLAAFIETGRLHELFRTIATLLK